MSGIETKSVENFINLINDRVETMIESDFSLKLDYSKGQNAFHVENMEPISIIPQDYQWRFTSRKDNKFVT